ncbi:hypothetical protein M2444_006157 [Paenibacillus sp. PastF-3]|nr:hypothetical protein [Paenibacillus sp. PastF-3]MDH6374307.1 hypothetical protein [Paenibacillus sp. PastF-3]
MVKKGKLITFQKKATKIIDRTQAEIMNERKEKRNELLNNLKKNKK